MIQCKYKKYIGMIPSKRLHCEDSIQRIHCQDCIQTNPLLGFHTNEFMLRVPYKILHCEDSMRRIHCEDLIQRIHCQDSLQTDPLWWFFARDSISMIQYNESIAKFFTNESIVMILSAVPPIDCAKLCNTIFVFI